MRLMSLLKKLVSKDDQQQEETSINGCTHEVVLKPLYFDMLVELFEEGNPIYREIGKYVYMNNVSKMSKEVFDPLNNMAQNGCEYNDTYLKFYAGSTHYCIILPLPVFAEKNKIRNFKGIFKSHQWYRETMKNIELFKNR